MILNRNAGLWAGLIQASINVIACVLVVITQQPLTPDMLALFATLNAFGSVVVALVANEADPTATNLTPWGTTCPPTSSTGSPIPQSSPSAWSSTTAAGVPTVTSTAADDVATD